MIGVNDLIHLIMSANARTVSNVIYGIRGSNSLVPLAASGARFLKDHLLAMKLLDGSYVLSVQVLILIHSGGIYNVIRLVLGTLGSRSC